MPSYICTTCGVGYAETDEPRDTCLVCADDRQYVNARGQDWTTLEALQENHVHDLRPVEPGLLGIGSSPQVAIGQRALVIQRPDGGVMWDCTPVITDAALDAIARGGGIRAIGISHPHFYASMIAWSERLGGVPVYLHADDAQWVMHPHANIRHWTGETLDLGEGVTLVRCGGHFAGSTALHWAAGAEGKGALFTADTIMVTPDPRWMSFMYSFPNLIPLNARAVETIVKSVRAYQFDRIYAGWWDRVLDHDAKAAVQRSAERYIAAIR